jgi:transposase
MKNFGMTLSEGEIEELQLMAESDNPTLAQRAQAVLLYAGGLTYREAARAVGIPGHSVVYYWVQRVRQGGPLALEGVYDVKIYT